MAMNSAARQQTGTTPVSYTIGWRGQALLFLLALLLAISRRPDAVLNAQFWAEGGSIFYVRAYERGIASLWMTYNGYLNILPQLLYVLVLSIPLSLAPLATNLLAIGFEILPVNIFLSSRFSFLSIRSRLLISGLYLALPNSFEIHATLTNLFWHLAVLSFLALIATTPASLLWRAFDGSVLVLSSVSGPLGIFLIPVAWAKWHCRAQDWTRTLCILLLPGTAIQVLTTIASHSRPVTPIGATLPRFVGILGRQVFISTTLGLASLYALAPHLQFGWDSLAAGSGMLMLGYALWRGPLELKLFIAFAIAVFAAGLAKPIATSYPPPMRNPPQWEAMQALPGCANRYYFFLNLAFCVALAWTAWNRGSAKVWRGLAMGVLMFLPVGICRDWSYPRYANLHFQEYAQRFQNAPQGSHITIPLNPLNPPGWKMELTKH